MSPRSVLTANGKPSGRRTSTSVLAPTGDWASTRSRTGLPAYDNALVGVRLSSSPPNAQAILVHDSDGHAAVSVYDLHRLRKRANGHYKQQD